EDAAAPSDSHKADLGRHWEEAGEAEKARACYLGAARRAAGVYSHAEAERLYRAYLALAAAPTPEAVRARNELGEKVLEVQGRSEAARQEHERALAEALRIGDPEGEAESLRRLGVIHWRLGRLEEARGLLGQALAIHRATGDRRAEGITLRLLAIVC